MTAVGEEFVDEERRGLFHTWLHAGAHAEKTDFAGDHFGNSVGVGRCACSAAPDVISNVVDLWLFFDSDKWPCSRAAIGAEDDTAVKNASADGRAGFHELLRPALFPEVLVTGIEGEVESELFLVHLHKSDDVKWAANLYRTIEEFSRCEGLLMEYPDELYIRDGSEHASLKKVFLQVPVMADESLRAQK